MQYWLAVRKVWENAWRKEAVRLRRADDQRAMWSPLPQRVRYYAQRVKEQAQNDKVRQHREVEAQRMIAQITKLSKDSYRAFAQLRNLTFLAPAERRRRVVTFARLSQLQRREERRLQVADRAVAKRIRAASVAARKVWEKYEPRGVI